jgi:hypothetical protein
MLIVRVKKFTLMVRVAGLHRKSNFNLICKEKTVKMLLASVATVSDIQCTIGWMGSVERYQDVN